MNAKPLLVAIDIDGTVADFRHRLHHLTANGHDGAPHHIPPGVALREFIRPDRLAEDAPIAGAFEAIAKMMDHPRVVLAFITARGEQSRDVTRSWLCRHWRAGFAQRAVAAAPMLYMRALRDERESHIVKRELAVRALAEHNAAPGVWADDDPEMLKAARSLGFAAMMAPRCWAPEVINVMTALALNA